jgi:hypothetical protein
MEKADHEETLPTADGEEVAGGFGASFREWRLKEVLHTAAVLRHRRMAGRGNRRRQRWWQNMTQRRAERMIEMGKNG